MVSTVGLEPISRHILADYYDELPFPPLCNDVFRLSSHVQSMAFDLLKHSTASQDEKLLINEVKNVPVYQIERNLWKNREHIEEILCLIGDSSRWPTMIRQRSTPESSELAGVIGKMGDMFQDSLGKLVSFQDMISERVFSTVTSRLPHVTARSLINRLKEQETIGKAKVDDLVASGASIGARCALLWEQQMDMRRQLARSCNSLCLIKTYSEHNGTVPKGVLSSLPTINNDDWPMEEQRERYGPSLYRLTVVILSIRLFLSLLWRRYEAGKLKQDQTIFLYQAVDVYTHELQRFFAFLSQVFTGSPFFKIYDFEEINVAAGETHEVPLEVDAVKSNIAWDFRSILPVLPLCKVNLNIEFIVKFTDAFGNETIILPKKLCGADKGSFVAAQAGSYKFVWDNSYSSFFTKYIHYKVVCTPPDVEPEESGTKTEM